MPFIEINGKRVEAEAGSMIIEVADSAQIHIPRFCYHKKLSIAANCRMCLVEVERSPKPLPACATPITEGMKIWTQSALALRAQKSVMEFLLINHPLDCPICDQGGECELQDLSLGYGKDISRYTEGKRVVKDKNLGPLISTEMTRCIQCTRCVRFGTEIAGVRELGATGRGECMEIGTYIEHSVDSEVSGNIIDLCPVGALTSKPFRFTARGWELKQIASISPHDCLGSNLFIHTRRNRVMRVVPKENENINEVWISDRDRYSYEGLYHSDRLMEPKIKRAGKWYTATWEEALGYVTKRLLGIKKATDATSIGALISPNSTLEEGYLFQKLMRGIGIHNIDHRLRQSDFRDQMASPLFPNLGIPVSDIEHQSTILLIGSALRQEQPLLALKMRKMTAMGGKALVINPIDFAFNFDVTEKSIVSGGNLVLGVARVAKALLMLLNKNAPPILNAVEPLAADLNMAKYLLNGATDNASKKHILLGALAISHPDYSQIRSLANFIADLTNSTMGILSEGANSAGMWLSGCVPHRLPGGTNLVQETGLNTSQMWDKKLKAYFLYNLDPDLDCLNGVKTMQALSTADCVIAITAFESKALLEVAEVLLPMVPFTETAGTFVNVEGKWQSFKTAALPLGNSRPGWKILQALGHMIALPNFSIEASSESAEAILALLKAEITALTQTELKSAISTNLASTVLNFNENTEVHKVVRIAPTGIYATDGLVRRAKSLQETALAKQPAVSLNSILQDRLKLTEGLIKVIFQQSEIVLPYVIDDSVPDSSVLIPAGIAETIALGEPYATIELVKV